MTRTRTPGSRAGMGAPLTVVLSLLLILSLFALSLSLRSRAAAHRSYKASSSERAGVFAEMGVTEAMNRIRSRANEPGERVFEALRTRRFPVAWELSLAELPFLAEELGRYEAFETTGVYVTVLRRGGVSLFPEEMVDYDGAGVIRLECAVTGPVSVTSAKTIEYGYRQVLTAPARPFDMFTFCVLDPQEFLDRNARGGDANETIEFGVVRMKVRHELLEELAKQLQEAERQVQQQMATQAMSGQAAQAQALLQELQRIVQHLREKIGEWPADPDWELRDESGKDDENVVHPFPAPLSVYSFAEEVDLGRLNVADRIHGLVQEVEELEPRIEQARQEWLALLEKLEAQELPQQGAMEEVASRFVDQVMEQVVALDRILTAYKEFQDDLVELGGEQAEALRRRFRRFSASEQRRRAQYVFEGPGATLRAEEFFSRVPLPSGVVWVDDHEVEAKLRVRLRGYAGRLVIATTGDMDVEAAQVADPSRDAVTLVCHGRLLATTGGNQAALVSGNDDYQGGAEDHQGALVLERISPSASNLVMSGTVKRQEALVTSPVGAADRPPPRGDCLEVALGAAPIYRREDR